MTATTNGRPDDPDPGRALGEVLSLMRQARRHHVPASLAERVDRLARLDALLDDEQDALASAVDQDFGGRSRHETLLGEIAPTRLELRHVREHLPAWMGAEARPVGLPLLGGRAEIVPQPLGVIGVIAPWNLPIRLALGPLLAALAAGNAVILKPSELTPRTSALLARALGARFAADEVHVACGGPEVAQALARLPVDHLFFTGSAAVGKLVMRAASETLTPVTLELGGKSPAIVGPDADLEEAASSIVRGKLFNAGQTCVAPDYAVVPRAARDAFVAACQRAARRFYPRFAENGDYSAIRGLPHRARLDALVADATARGARAVALGAPAAPRAGESRYPPLLLLDVTDGMAVMQEEIFGPLLPVRTYEWLGEALDDLAARPRPLALYYFGRDRATCEDVIARTMSGGVCINDTLIHALQHDLPFGGVGASGMGRYHGLEGFMTFSHPRSVLWSSSASVTAWLSPPYGELPARAIRWLVDRGPR